MAASQIEILSVSAPIETEYTIKRSRFFSSIRHITSHADFEEKMKEISSLYPKANHHCWAYRLHISDSNIIEHSSDAGEPSGSAGRPILGMLKRYGLLDTMIAVTRFFGGIKLGIPGLIAAYGTSAELAIQSAEIVAIEDLFEIQIGLSYDIYDKFIYIANKAGVSKDDMTISYSSDISGSILLRRSLFEKLLPALEDLASNNANFSFIYQRV